MYRFCIHFTLIHHSALGRLTLDGPLVHCPHCQHHCPHLPSMPGQPASAPTPSHWSLRTLQYELLMSQQNIGANIIHGTRQL